MAPTTPMHAATGGGDDGDATKTERMLKKRLSAKRSREVAKQHVQLLERNVAFLSKHSHMLAHRLALVEAENRLLRSAMLSSKPTRETTEPAALSSSLQWMPLVLLFAAAASSPPPQHCAPRTASSARPLTRLAVKVRHVRWGPRSLPFAAPAAASPWRRRRAITPALSPASRRLWIVKTATAETARGQRACRWSSAPPTR